MKNENRTETATAHTPKELLSELQSLVSEAQTMMTDSLSEHSAEAIENLRQRFAVAQERFSEAYQGAKQRVVAGAKRTDVAIRENPYQALAIAAGVGLIVGVLLGRRNR